jgi:glycosyltransferase involved in cell wall biosynthesis
VTTDYFGSEIIENDRNGYIIPVGDAEELSRKIQKISNEPETIKRLVRGAGETYIPTVADECLALESFYEKLSPAAAVAASAAPAGDSRQ